MKRNVLIQVCKSLHFGKNFVLVVLVRNFLFFVSWRLTALVHVGLTAMSQKLSIWLISHLINCPKIGGTCSLQLLNLWRDDFVWFLSSYRGCARVTMTYGDRRLNWIEVVHLLYFCNANSEAIIVHVWLYLACIILCCWAFTFFFKKDFRDISISINARRVNRCILRGQWHESHASMLALNIRLCASQSPATHRQRDLIA